MDGYVTIGTMIDTKSFDAQMNYIEEKMLDIEDKLQKADMGFEVGDTQKLEAEYERLGNQLLGLKEKQEKYNQAIREAEMSGFSKIKESVDGIGNSLQKVTKKIAKTALAVFGIHSAFMFVRSAINTIAGDDEQLKADIDYMKNAIAYTLEPVIRGIVNLSKQLLFYIQYIVKAWTGKNIFENANKSLAGANKQAKALRKTMAGFDEMNVLNDSSSSSGGVGPSFDLTALEDVPIPSWIQWIADNGQLVKTIIEGIGIAIASLKIAEFLKTLGLFGKLPIWQLVGGIALIITGVGLAIKGVIDFIKDPSWHNFLTILEGISLVVAGIAVLMGGWVVALIALGVAIVTYVIQNWDKVKEILGKVGSWIYDHIIKPVGNFFAGLWNGIKTGVGNTVQWVKDKFSSIINFFSNLISRIVGLFREIGTKVGDVIGGAFKAVINGVLRAIENILNFPIRTINSLIRTINKVPGINLGTLTEFNLPRLAKGGIINNPGSGVMVGSAIAGERGKEGVIPLTDSQQMAILGEAIGKYITINANITNTMNGRVLSRELQKVQNESNFAYNR